MDELNDVIQDMFGREANEVELDFYNEVDRMMSELNSEQPLQFGDDDE